MQLFIKGLTGETRTVEVNPETKIVDLKQIIAPLYEASFSHIKLSVNNGHVIQLDKDQKTVSDYGLSSGSTVMLLNSATPMPFQIFVKNEKGQTKTYEISDNETVDQLMRKITQKERTPVDQQRLIFNGQQLNSGRKLQDYNITPESTIHMTLRLRGG